MLTVSLTRPAHWNAPGVRSTQVGPDDPDGRYIRRLPCGCEGHFRRVVGGPLDGHTYGDAQYKLCPQHAIHEEE